MDPLCEKYYSTSPYAWCGNNPVNLVDPDGRDWYFNNDSNKYCYNEEILSQKDIDDRKMNGTYKAQTFEDEATTTDYLDINTIRSLFKIHLWLNILTQY